MPKILYLWQGSYPWEVRVEKFCKVFRDKGADVTVLARWKFGQKEEEEYQGSRILRVGAGMHALCSLPVSCNPVWVAAIQRQVATWKPDLILAREVLLSEGASLVARRRRIPVVIDMAEHYPATMRSWKKYRKNAFLRFLVFHARVPDLVEKRAVLRADGVITVCAEQNDRLHRLFGYPHEKMAEVQNTPDLATFAPVKKGAASPPRVFGYHGTMTAQRGLDNLILGFALAVKDNPELRLLLAGDGESHADLVRLANSCGVADKVRFTGRYRFEDLVRLYGETDIGVVPQPPDESCNHTVPNKLYDYLACGKPVLVSPAAPLKRIVEETGTGLAFDSCAPPVIARSIEQLSRTNLEPMSERGLDVARTTMNWGHDSEVLWGFLKKFF